jgi:hypothetical protein
MKLLLILLIAIFPILLSAQDYIVLENKTVEHGKITEVTATEVKLVKHDIPDGPAFVFQNKDINTIVFENGSKLVYDTLNPFTIIFRDEAPKTDTCNYSKIYVIFDYGTSESEVFPLYLNDTYIYAMKNHTKVTCTLFSEGQLQLYRKYLDKLGPSVTLDISHGQFYAVRITLASEYSMDPNKKFSLELISDPAEVKQFISGEYVPLQTWKTGEKVFTEDTKHPLIK